RSSRPALGKKEGREEEKWLALQTVPRNPPFLQRLPAGPVSERKLRLFLCACCRRIWDRLPDDSHRRAIEVAERFADGLADLAALEEARWPVWQRIQYDTVRGVTHAASWAVLRTAGEGYWPRAPGDASEAAEDRGGEREAQLELLRCIFGNPYRPAALGPAWLAWNGGAVRQMAWTIYEERRFEE